MESVTISRLRAHNFMGLESLDLTLPPTGVIEFRGKNTHGKTSVLRGVDSVIVGQRACPERAVRNGAKTAGFSAEFTDGVTAGRRWTNPDERTATVLEVTKEGYTRPKPQEYMRDLAPIALDPVAFVSLPAKDKTERVLRMVDFGDFDLVENGNLEEYHRELLSEKEAERNRLLQEIETDEVACAGAPDDLVDVEALSGELAEAKEHNAGYQGLVNTIQDRSQRLEDHQEFQDGLLERKKRLQAELQETEEAIEAGRMRFDELVGDVTAAVKERDTFEHRATDKLESDLATASRLNELFHARERLNELKNRAGDVVKERTDAHLEVTKLVEERDKALDAAEFPVEGLAYNVPTGSLMLNGFPLTQASDAEQIMVAFAMMVAQNPPLKVATARQGSLLDSETRAELDAYAREAGWQVLLEVVADEKPDEVTDRIVWVDEAKRAPAAV